MRSCPFCKIIKGNLEASVIYEDDLILGIVPLRAPYPESALVFPKEHIDHFTDLPKQLAIHVMSVGFELGKRIMSEYSPDRIGMGVHGYGVAHAHFNVFPQNHANDVVFGKMAYIKEGEIRFGFRNLPAPSRDRMNDIAKTLRNRI